MKKTIMTTFIIIFGIGVGAMAQSNGGGLFKRGHMSDEQFYGAGYYNDRNNGSLSPVLPGHNSGNNEDANAPLGSGVAVLLSLGAAYALGKRHKGK